MKNILLSGLALGGLLFASSCQMDEPDAGTLTGEVDFTITAGIPSGITTYSPTDGTAFSHLGGANNVNSGEYDLRYILEVYDGETLAYRDVQYVDEGFTDSKASFSARLLAKSYTFVLWADFVEDGSKSDLYYNAESLKEISYKTTNTADLTKDEIDAYTAKKVIDLSESSKSESISLTRPFGKIRLLATDKDIANNDPETPVSVKLDFGSAKFPSSFNALTGDVSGELAIGAITTPAVFENASSVDGNITYEKAYLLGYVYTFASTPQAAYPIDVTVYSDADATSQIGHRELTGIPVSANKLTTVVGNFYSNEGNLEVKVEDMFTNGEEEVPLPIVIGSFEELSKAFLEGGDYMLSSNIVIPENQIVKISEGTTTGINLNGHVLSTTNSEGQIFQDMFEVVGTLNISNGTVQFRYTGENMGWNGGTAVFNVHGGGILNMEDVVVNDLGGTDMSFCVHLNNWGDVTLNADNCEFNSPYCGVRVFNSGPDMNNVSITNSELTGATRAFWVHNYIGDLSATDDEINNRLKIDIYNNNNTFALTGTAISPIRYGIGNPVYFAENGELVDLPVIDDSEKTVQISSASAMSAFAIMVNNGETFENYRVTLNTDIDLGNKPWTPIGNGSRGSEGGSSFSGVFDGNGHTIRNINVTEDRDNYGAGLFSVVKGGTVKNITVEGGSIKAFDYGAAVVGIMLGESTVENCHARNVEISSGDAAAGIVARAYGTNNTITGCTNSCNITTAKKAGGIVGIASNGGATKIENCSNSGTVYASDAGAAGILGYAGPATNSIINSSNTGTIGRITDKYAGGIVGYQASTDETAGLIIKECNNSGEISAINAGGIYGIPGSSQPVHITDSKNNGDVTGIDAAGGIACRAGSGTIENCTNTANVTAATENKGVAGGIAGNLGEAKIINCSGGGASAVITAQYPGRLVGHVANKPYSPDDVEASITIDDSNGDDYSNYKTIAAMGLYTAWSNINIEGGTLHGKPAIDGQASGYIKIHSGAAWDQYPDETGTWKCSPTDNNVWTKVN